MPDPLGKEDPQFVELCMEFLLKLVVYADRQKALDAFDMESNEQYKRLPSQLLAVRQELQGRFDEAYKPHSAAFMKLLNHLNDDQRRKRGLTPLEKLLDEFAELTQRVAWRNMLPPANFDPDAAAAVVKRGGADYDTRAHLFVYWLPKVLCRAENLMQLKHKDQLPFKL